MGPTQSTVAWPGCAEDGRDHQDGFPPNKQDGEATMQHTLTNTKQKTDTAYFAQHEQYLARQAQGRDRSDTMEDEYHDDSHHVSVSTLYEFALCRKIKETFIKGVATTTSETDSHSRHAELNKGLSSSSLAAAAEEDDDDDVWSSSVAVVSDQPQSLTTLSRSETDSEMVEHETDTGNTKESKRTPGTVADADKHTDKHSGDDITKSSKLSVNQAQQKIDEVNKFLEQAETANESNIHSKDVETSTADIEHNNESTATTSSSMTSLQPTNITQTETKATQTSLPHPAVLSLAPPPSPLPKPVMISVSTPPDETSSGMFYKLSQNHHHHHHQQQQMLTPPGVSYLAADDVTLSSPDIESDSDAGYVHLRGRFGSGGATAAGGAAGGSESACNTPEMGRRKRSKKKEEKGVEYILRQMQGLCTPEEKLATMCKKYTDLHEEQKALNLTLKQHQRKMNVIVREKDQLQTEHNQVVMKKCKLETLCRELQKQNKTVKDESLLRAKEEDEKRKQMTAKFKTSIAEIQQKVNDNHEQNLKLHEENKVLSQRLKALMEKHQDRECEIDRVTSHHRDLELRLAQTRLQQAAQALREEQEQHLREKEKILIQANEGNKRNSFLESELSKYKERYEEFQDTIDKSSSMFDKLKSDIDRMGNNIKKLEKEGEQWKRKWETSNTALHLATQDKSKCEKENNTLNTKVSRLESLCRALQTQLQEARKTASTASNPGTEATASSSSSSSSSASQASSSSSSSSSSDDALAAPSNVTGPDSGCAPTAGAAAEFELEAVC